MQRRIASILNKVVPALVALVVVLLEPVLTIWMKGRESVLPLAMLLLLSAMLHPRLRYLLVITLCYGVAFLALRDALRVQPLPPVMDYDLIEAARPAALCLVAGLATLAAIGETLRPGAVWARRCYFGAAALYFSGIGLINFVWHNSWQSILLCITGVIALFGCLFAHRIVADETEEEEEVEESDEIRQQEREAAHMSVLRAKEWREPFADATEPASDRESSSPGPAAANNRAALGQPPQ